MTTVDPSTTPASDVDIDVVELAGHLRFAVARLNRQLRHQDQSGLSATLGAALASISRDGPLTLSQLAACEQVSPPSVTRLVDKLVDRGFVSRQVDPDDRRVTRVRITPAGRRQLESIRTRRTAWLASRLAELPPDDVARLDAALAVLDGLVAPPSRPSSTPTTA